MALHWQWSDKIGTLCIAQKRVNGDKEFDINIYTGNALAIFVSEYKDEDGQDVYSIYKWIDDKKHAERIIKEYGTLFCDRVVSIELNLRFRETKQLLDILTKNGYSVTCYYK